MKESNEIPANRDVLRKKRSGGDLIVEAEAGQEQETFGAELEQTLRETEAAVIQLTQHVVGPAASWEVARGKTTEFKPVPWFIWRLSNYVFGRTGQQIVVGEGLVLGLRRLLFAAASDPVIGTGTKIQNVRVALSSLSADVIAACAVIHAICRRLASGELERIWRPIVDDALLRARIGFRVGAQCADFGSGRGMLAGFAGRAGLAVLISTGTEQQASEALERLATGAPLSRVGRTVYGCDPLQVSAMLLSAAGCGRDASFGTVSFSSEDPLSVAANDEQRRWLAAFTITEAIRGNKRESLEPQYIEIMGLSDADLEQLVAETKKMVRAGHGWNWLL